MLMEVSTTPAAALAIEDDLLYRKITWKIVPFLFTCYVVSFLDRINIGFAQLQMKQDLGFSDAIYGLGAAVFYVGYVLCEVPSNMLLVKFGARFTFARIMLLWGLASTAMALVATPTHFFALRFLLGVFEAGFFPGIVFYVTFWFPPDRRAGVLSIFFVGVAVAGVFGGLISGWIMHSMAGVAGISGWKWMFAIEGSPALVLALVALFFMVDRPRDARWLTPAEKLRVEALCEGRRSSAGVHDSEGFMSVLRNPRAYILAFIYFSLTCASLTLSFWMPLMIRDSGVEDVMAVSLYSAVPNLIGAIGLIFIARHSDRSGERRRHFFACVCGGALALGALTLNVPSLPLLLGLLSLAAALIFAALPIFWSAASTYLVGNAAATGIAFISSVGITSGIASPWVIGEIRSSTGRMDLAIYLLVGLLLASGIALMFGVGNGQAHRASVPTK